MSTKVKQPELDRKEIRRRLMSVSREEFEKAHTKADLEGMAETMGADITEAKTKSDIVEAIVAVAKLPDPSLRGRSTVDSPVARMWEFCDEVFAEAAAKGEAPPRRKDVNAAAIKLGIAPHTARTQYQCWFTATNKGQVRLADLPVDSLPRVLQPAEDEEEA